LCAREPWVYCGFMRVSTLEALVFHTDAPENRTMNAPTNGPDRWAESLARLLELLREHGGRRTWSGPAPGWESEDGEPRGIAPLLECWVARGRMVLVTIYERGEGGWDVLRPVTDSDGVEETLQELRAYLGGEEREEEAEEPLAAELAGWPGSLEDRAAILDRLDAVEALVSAVRFRLSDALAALEARARNVEELGGNLAKLGTVHGEMLDTLEARVRNAEERAGVTEAAHDALLNVLARRAGVEAAEVVDELLRHPADDMDPEEEEALLDSEEDREELLQALGEVADGLAPPRPPALPRITPDPVPNGSLYLVGWDRTSEEHTPSGWHTLRAELVDGDVSLERAREWWAKPRASIYHPADVRAQVVARWGPAPRGIGGYQDPDAQPELLQRVDLYAEGWELLGSVGIYQEVR